MTGTTLIEAPDGVEFTITVFLYSEQEDLEVRVAVSGMPAMVPLKKDFDPLALLGASAAAMREAASDWRVMTRDEIKDYKRRNDEDNDNDE